jgi:pre-mRNA-splicing factor 18
MQALKAEIAAKRKAIEESSANRPTKYMRRGDIERLQMEQEMKDRGEQSKKLQSVEVLDNIVGHV